MSSSVLKKELTEDAVHEVYHENKNLGTRHALVKVHGSSHFRHHFGEDHSTFQNNCQEPKGDIVNFLECTSIRKNHANHSEIGYQKCLVMQRHHSLEHSVDLADEILSVESLHDDWSSTESIIGCIGDHVVGQGVRNYAHTHNNYQEINVNREAANYSEVS